LIVFIFFGTIAFLIPFGRIAIVIPENI